LAAPSQSSDDRAARCRGVATNVRGAIGAPYRDVRATVLHRNLARTRADHFLDPFVTHSSFLLWFLRPPARGVRRADGPSLVTRAQRYPLPRCCAVLALAAAIGGCDSSGASTDTDGSTGTNASTGASTGRGTTGSTGTGATGTTSGTTGG